VTGSYRSPSNENLNEDMEDLLDEAMLDEAQEAKLEKQFAREYHLITRDDRLEEVAKDMVAHFMGRGFRGKGMMIAIDKTTAVKMYDKVQKYWKLYLDNLKAQLPQAETTQRELLEAKIRYMEETDMAVVVSQEQNEIEKFKEKGLDIKPHRERMVKEDLEELFKDSNSKLRLVFVCAMWLTGFDAPSISTLYLDKPMRNHTLMQTIARANRVFADKNNGLIVDYVGVFRNLQKALAIYATPTGDSTGDMPVKDKAALLEMLEQAIEALKGFCVSLGVRLEAIAEASGFERVKRLDDAVEAILTSEDSKKKYLSLQGQVQKLYKAILPDSDAEKFNGDRYLFNAIAEKIRSLAPDVDISEVMSKVEKLLDESIAPEGFVISQEAERPEIDLSKIDFQSLREHFNKGKKHTAFEQLRNATEKKIQELVEQNRTRMNYLERFQRLIDEYNAGTANVELLFDKLVALTQELNEEEKRAIKEELINEEYLVIFDLLTKPEMDLSAKEINEVKKVTRELLDELKRNKLVLDWRKRQQTRAEVRLTIENTLDQGLPRAYSPEMFEKKCDIIYQHIYESYAGDGRSKYAG
jgi:type I restriction enzyme R subunit